MGTTNTYNDDIIEEKSRAVFFKALDRAEKMLDGTDTMNDERMASLAQIADAAATQFATDTAKEMEHADPF